MKGYFLPRDNPLRACSLLFGGDNVCRLACCVCCGVYRCELCFITGCATVVLVCYCNDDMRSTGIRKNLVASVSAGCWRFIDCKFL